MEANELRIGNYIMHHESTLRVTGIDEHYFSHNEIDGCTRDILYEAKQIELTEEWLFKFGFKKLPKENSREKDKYSKSFVEISNESNGLWAYQNTTYFFWVHNLQNLYFALTGEELTI